MVHVEKDYTAAPEKLLDNKWDDIKADVLTNPKHDAKSSCYRGTTLTTLVKLYSNKCACCERSRGEELQVDHYRPKKARQNKDVIYKHDGYYWLTYEWSNLIPLCSSCNQAKSNYFPLKDSGERVTNNSHAKANNARELYTHEKPLFVNPEIDTTPERHFKYLPTGEVKGRTDEGKTMVKFYKLNSKTKKRERKEIIKEYILDIQKSLDRYYKDNEVERDLLLKGSLRTTFERIVENGNIDKPLSLMHDYIRRYFGIFIKNHFHPSWQVLLVILFDDYQKKWHF